MWRRVERGQPTALSRYADGEQILMEGGAVPQSATVFVEDGWWAEGGLTRLGRDLLETLDHTEPEYFYAIPGRDDLADMDFYLRRLRTAPEQVTFATLFCNANYGVFRERLEALGESVVVMASKYGAARALGRLRILEYAPMEHDCVHYWEHAHAAEQARAVELARRYERTLFLVAAGPMANVLIHTMFGANPTNRYLDVGSALDELVHGRRTRPYMHPGTDYSAHVSHFSTDPEPAERPQAPATFVTAVYDLDPDDALGGRARGIAYYLASLRSLAKMKAPCVIHTWPRAVDEVRRVARDEGLMWNVVGFDLSQAPRFETIQEMRLRKDYPSMRWRDRCHVLCLTKVHWLAEQARLNPFGSERFYWIDAGLSYPGLFPRRYLDAPDGFDCALFGPDTVRALDARPALLLLGIRDALDDSGMLHTVPVRALERLAGEERGPMRTHVVGGLFGGSRAAIDDLAREYDEVLAALLAADHLGTEENVLSVLYHRRPELYSLEPFTTWYHEDSGRLRPGDDSDSFFRIFERLAPQRSVQRVARRRRADVTVILNTYKRPHTLRPQYEAVVGQSCMPAEVFVWQNHPDHGQGVEVDPSAFDQDVLDRCVTVNSVNTNFGVWGRFAFALNARTTYVCVLDDDTIPGARWLENCLETMRTHRGLLGAVGIVHEGTASFAEHRRVGWCAPNQNVEAVDYVGHAWFFEREWLTAFWRELPSRELFAYESEPHALCAGEDMHFSYTLQKYLGLGTFVPPHPVTDRSLWGSDPDLAAAYGTDDAAVSNLRQPHWKFDKAWAHYRARGFRFLCETRAAPEP